MRRLRDFAAIRYFLSEREIEELQAAADARREAREEAPKAATTATAPGSGSGYERA